MRLSWKKSGRKVDVSPFSPNYKPLIALAVDAALQYDNPYNGQLYILVIRDALYVLVMSNNLLSPFMLREAGVWVIDVPKIHVKDPTENNHNITFVETGFRIPLSLWGTFSYFPSYKPLHKTLMNPPDVYVMSPTRWNPHSNAYAHNEESMIDWNGNIKEKRDHTQVVFVDDLPGDASMVSSLQVPDVEQRMIDRVFDDNDYYCPPESHCGSLEHKLNKMATESGFNMSIGSTDGDNSPYLVSDYSISESPMTSDCEEDESISSVDPVSYTHLTLPTNREV